MPMVWITALLIFAVATRNQKRRKKVIITTLILIVFFGNDFIANELLRAWEKEPVPIATLSNHDYGIVLTGVTVTERSSYDDRVFFSKGADRVIHAVQLYKMGKIKKIIISGGAATVVAKPVNESHQLKKVFLLSGIPEQDLILEDQSRNTRENATFTRKTIDSLQLKGNFLLITSAFHMRRAEGCFNKAGIKADIFPVDIYTRDRRFTPNYLIIPSESAFGKWALLIHEVIGYIVYKTMGYA